MRILLVSYHLGGVTAEGLVTARVVRALAATGHEVVAIAGPGSDEGLDGLSVARPAPAKVLAARRLLDRLAAHNRLAERLASAWNLAAGIGAVDAAWVAGAAAVARRRLEAEPFDVLHSRLNPVSSHLVALRLGRSRPPWCASFSDPWPHHLYPPPYRFTVGPWSRRRGEATLDRILATAGSLVFPSGRLRDHLLSGSRERFRARTTVVPHLGVPHLGEAGWPAVVPDPGFLTIRHGGFLMRERRIEPLAEGLRRFLEARPEARAKLRVAFAGRVDGGVPPAPPAGLAEVVRFEPWRPPAELREWLAAADVLLLVEAAMAEGIFFPSKLAEYLTAGRPILALSPAAGVAADLLAPGGGLRVAPDDPAAIAGAVAELYERWAAGRLAELGPSAEQAAGVSAATVVPLLEGAFQAAVERSGSGR